MLVAQYLLTLPMDNNFYDNFVESLFQIVVLDKYRPFYQWKWVNFIHVSIAYF